MSAQSDAATEAAALREGEYVAVRRFTRLLEGGAEAKAALDQVRVVHREQLLTSIHAESPL